jgi:peroxiredoxin
LKIYRVNTKESAETIKKFLEKEPIQLPVLLDPTGKMGKMFGLWVHPTTYIISRKGLIVYRAIGQIEWTGPEAASVINVLIQER